MLFDDAPLEVFDAPVSTTEEGSGWFRIVETSLETVETFLSQEDKTQLHTPTNVATVRIFVFS